ncbi:MAG: hypothetical protein AseanaTS_06850 [Candidatus Pelagadaptatus aseana]|uniref:hypothetical protein n=1 Tax=Candidatus Pelagadaptatus aseana TaxID=3120508 RepID=UPI0039B2CBC9
MHRSIGILFFSLISLLASTLATADTIRHTSTDYAASVSGNVYTFTIRQGDRLEVYTDRAGDMRMWTHRVSNRSHKISPVINSNSKGVITLMGTGLIDKTEAGVNFKISEASNGRKLVVDASDAGMHQVVDFGNILWASTSDSSKSTYCKLVVKVIPKNHTPIAAANRAAKQDPTS